MRARHDDFLPARSSSTRTGCSWPQGLPPDRALDVAEKFGGRAAFVRETNYLATASRAAAVAPGQPAVRMPGDRALRRRVEQLTRGVALHADILPALLSCGREFKVDIPSVILEGSVS